MKRTIAIILCCFMCFMCFSADAQTTGEKNALGAAQLYLSIMNFSYEGLVEILQSDGFTEPECKYAADNCGADWYEQAAGSATTYLSIMSFSKAGLIEILLSDGYTMQEATYGASVAYNENASMPEDKESRSESASQPSNHAESSQASENNASTNTHDTKEVTVPVGDYIVGEDIPAGNYTLTSDKYSVLKVYKSQNASYYDDSYEVEKPDFIVGKVTLHDGMAVQIVYAPMTFSTYTGISGIASLQAQDGHVTIPVGDYIVGEDLPEGVYYLTGTQYAVLKVYSSSNATYYDNSYEIEKPDFTIGRVALKKGMKVQVVYGSIDFSQYTRLNCFNVLEQQGEATIPVGDYIVGADIPEGTYTLTASQYSVLKVYKNSSARYYDNSYECEKPDFKIGKINLTNGMFVQVVYSPMTFKPYQGLGF